MNTLTPGSTIGMLGGGQLGRMMAMAAAELGFKTHVFCPDLDNPTEQVANAATHADYEDHAALEAFANSVDVVTYEFENIPVSTVEFLKKTTNVFPSSKVLEVSQDRLSEKTFINKLGIETAPFKGVSTLEEAATALEGIGYPAVLKTRRFGYDGKGQAIVKSEAGLADAWQKLNSKEIIIEGFINFDLEISVVAARSQSGEIKCFAPVENIHKNHILDLSIAPARIDQSIKELAIANASKIVEKLDYVGVLTVEYFVSQHDPVLRVNEIAPRVHNSGHWTIEACPTSQFEQHIRAICGLPLGCVDFIGEARMTNLIGDDIDQYGALLAEKGASVHHYGKSETRAGRKMGHVTRLYPNGY
ncbi:5-(carboxyamino)imidazole ribonucleotide synthase [Pseudemcibacter aquimaris]|uniref:5-(carboxyamino)imidazole ribonucleotide synthase n=1 Tax=Pseudemcibacter aquimaris TaxID=2857064 RepID=UPI0020131803|nr:5-(carboxyamino)imidazole ribonucleotide synthase [Pseudemcibacter aquimaris]MCC3861427.1 5-(carboxyamino)imidazole ribonucleotide synthase [Pseudemcibacter aquimaris]WDU58197.1 5-(carboxyamino)imidazole ribonucleotide synthase [Pseudemcibacter aquimaris]